MSDFEFKIHIMATVTLLYCLNKNNKLSIVVLISTLIYLNPIQINLRNLSLYLMIITFGTLISRFIVKIYLEYFFNKKFSDFDIKYFPSQCLIAFKEEVIWRHLLVCYIYISLYHYLPNQCISMIISQIISFMSFYSVHRFKNNIQKVEFITFSFILIISSIIFPGLNIALHATRNMLVLSNNERS